jgi:DNA repair exonuclease SbcCD ATPase subunit
MMGYYAEMKDPKNADKTMQELKDIVFKNLSKNQIYYTENAQFGVKDLGYKTEAPALGEPKEAKGKFKSSGYGDLKEGYEKFASDIKDALTKSDKKFTPEEIKAKLKQKREEELKRRKEAGEPLEEIALREVIQNMIDEELNRDEYKDVLFKMEQPYLNDKEALDSIQQIYKSHIAGLNSISQDLKEGVEKDLAAINKEAEHEILSSKLEKIQALIDKKQSQLSKLDEDEDMKSLTDDKKVKEISKDIKALEKAKAKLEKMMGKVKGKVKRKEIIDEMDNSDEIVSNIPKDIRKDALKRLEVDGEEIDSIIGNYQNISFNDRNHLRMWLDSKKESNPDLNSELGVEDQY